MSDDNEICVIARGLRATRFVETADQIEPDFIAFVRSTVRWLDPTFPQTGLGRKGEKGQYPRADGQQNLFTQVEDFDADGRGVRIVRLLQLNPTGMPYDSNLSVAAIGLPDGASLTVRWDFLTTGANLRGKFAAIFVAGAGKEQCVADFRQ